MVPELARGGGAGHDLELGAVVGAVVGEREAVVWLSAYARILTWTESIPTSAQETDLAVGRAPGGVVVAGGAVHENDGGAISEGRLLHTQAPVRVAELQGGGVLARVGDCCQLRFHRKLSDSQVQAWLEEPV